MKDIVEWLVWFLYGWFIIGVVNEEKRKKGIWDGFFLYSNKLIRILFRNL